mmetsp:Transcript_114147/g.333697  ORF Transcript_114147/g.333697 Transcript_114147/m.333697 type:complete len:268 (+) Transcript_114147:1126-1929(+)
MEDEEDRPQGDEHEVGIEEPLEGLAPHVVAGQAAEGQEDRPKDVPGRRRPTCEVVDELCAPVDVEGRLQEVTAAVNERGKHDHVSAAPVHEHVLVDHCLQHCGPTNEGPQLGADTARQQGHHQACCDDQGHRLSTSKQDARLERSRIGRKHGLVFGFHELMQVPGVDEATDLCVHKDKADGHMVHPPLACKVGLESRGLEPHVFELLVCVPFPILVLLICSLCQTASNGVDVVIMQMLLNFLLEVRRSYQLPNLFQALADLLNLIWT